MDAWGTEVSYPRFVLIHRTTGFTVIDLRHKCTEQFFQYTDAVRFMQTSLGSLDLTCTLDEDPNVEYWG